MKSLYFRVVFGTIAVLALSFFVPQFVTQRIDRPQLPRPAIPLSEVTLSLLKDRLDQLRPNQLPEAVDSLAPILGHKLTLIAGDSPALPDGLRENLKNGILLERNHPPEPGRPFEEQPAYIWLSTAHQVLVLSPNREPRRPDPRSMVVSIAIVLAIAGIAGVFMVAPVVRSLRSLEATTTRFGDGDLNARATVAAMDPAAGVARQFNAMADSIQARIERERQLLQAVSHEMRTPIARIRFSLDLLRTASTEADRHHRMQEIDDEVVEIDTLVGELMDYHRLRSDHAAPARESLDLGALLDEMVERLRDLRAGVTVRVAPTPGESHQIVADRLMLKRVVQNLLLNALQHARTRVVISYERRDNAAWIAVDDDGPGIPSSERQRVLEPFVRLDASRSKESGGVGLGLAIVNHIVRLHGGSMEIAQADIGGARVMTIWPDEAKVPPPAG